MQALENWLGVKLLNRSTRRVALTEAGEAFYACEFSAVLRMTLLNSHWQAPLFNLFFIVRVAKAITQDQIDYVIEPKLLCSFRTEIPIQRYFQRVLVGKIVIAKR